MRIFAFELKKQLFFNTLIWTGVITAVLWLMLYGFYPLFLASRSAMESMLSSFPDELIAAMGFDLDDLFSFQSFSGMVYLYEGILAGIMASSTAIAVFAREKQNNCHDFLFTKPLRRPEIFYQKLLCCLTLVVAVNIPYIAVFMASYFDYTGTGTIIAPILLSILCLFFTQMVFLSFGIFAAVFLRRVRSSAGLGVGIGMFAFLLSTVYSLTEKEIFRFVSPLHYFSPAVVSETGGYDVSSVLTAAVLTLGMTAAAYLKYTKADIAV